MMLPRAIAYASTLESELCAAFQRLAEAERTDPEFAESCRMLSAQADGRASALLVWAERYPCDGFSHDRPVRAELRSVEPRIGLWNLRVLVRQCGTAWAMVERAAVTADQRQLLDLVTTGRAALAKGAVWLEENIGPRPRPALAGLDRSA